jgi:hypothetical protein
MAISCVVKHSESARSINTSLIVPYLLLQEMDAYIFGRIKIVSSSIIFSHEEQMNKVEVLGDYI